MIKGIIFDLDGVLIDSLAIHRDSFCVTLKEVFDLYIEQSFYDKLLEHKPTRDKLSVLESRDYIPKITDKDYKLFVSKRNRVFKEMLNSRSFHDVSFIKELSDPIYINKVNIACYSNSIPELVGDMLKSIKLDYIFDCVITGDDVIHKKPHPEGYSKIIKQWRLRPTQVLIIEDSPIGLEAAYSSGARVWALARQSDLTWDNLQKELGKYD